MLFKQPPSRDDLLGEFLTMSKEEKYLDTTLLCSDGRLRVSSLLLITVFPSIRDALRWRTREDDAVIISLPGIPKHDLEEFLDFVHNGVDTFKPNGLIRQLLQTPATLTRKVKVKEESVSQEEDKNRTVNVHETNAKTSSDLKFDEDADWYSGNGDVSDYCKTEMDDFLSLDNDYDDWSEGDSPSQPKRSGFKKKAKMKREKIEQTKEKRGRKKKEKDTNVNCPYCDYVAAQPRCLRPHIEVKHLNMRESFSCEICGKVYTSRSAVTLHMKSVHEKIRYSCDVEGCDYVCASGKFISYFPSSVEVHICFISGQQLKNHKLHTHEGVVFTCDRCGKTFATKSRMKKHVNTIHSDVMLMCEKCDYKTKCKIRLKEHTQAEHEGKKVCCPQCDFKTTWRKNLKAHIQSKHPSEFLHCDQCPFSTTLQRKLNNHRKIAHAAE